MKLSSYATMLLFVAMSLTASASEKDLKKVSESNIINMFHQIQTLNNRELVEEVLGEPLFSPLIQKDGFLKCWYLNRSEREILEHESPWGMGGIVVDYDKDERVVTSRFNFQWVDKKQVQEYRKKYGAKQDSSGNG